MGGGAVDKAPAQNAPFLESTTQSTTKSTAHATQETSANRQTSYDLDSIDAFVFYDKPFLKFERLLETYFTTAPRGFLSFLKAIPIWLKDKLFLKETLARELVCVYRELYPHKSKAQVKAFKQKVLTNLYFSEHHISHAASAFYPSPFSESAILVMDGVGEWSTTTIAKGSGNHIEICQELHFPHSLGLLYSAFTYYTGFKVNSGEYKVMGLAPYGEPKYVDLIKSHLIDIKDDGSFALDMRYFSYTYGLKMTNAAFDALFAHQQRSPESRLTQAHFDLAASIQVVTEEVMLKLARHALKTTGSKNLALSGGVALNCVGNGKIYKQLKAEGLLENIWIQPASGDAGNALGCALAYYHIEQGKPRGHSVLSDKSGNLRSDFQSLTPSKLLQSSLDNPLFSSQSLECPGKPSAECRENTESSVGLESSFVSLDSESSSTNSDSKQLTESTTSKNLSEALPIQNSVRDSASRAESMGIDSAIFAEQKSDENMSHEVQTAMHSNDNKLPGFSLKDNAQGKGTTSGAVFFDDFKSYQARGAGSKLGGNNQARGKEFTKSTKETSGSILDEKSGLCSCEQGDKTRASIVEACDKLPGFSLKDNAQGKGTTSGAVFFDDFKSYQARGAGSYLSGSDQAECADSLKSAKKTSHEDSMQGSYLGLSYTNTEVESALQAQGAVYERHEFATLIELTARALTQGKVIGWHQGRCEFGPRALGARSIIGDPRNTTMQKTMNLKIKYRESFRPFAPSVLAEGLSEWFELDCDSPYMLLVAPVSPSKCYPMSEAEQKLFGIDKLNVVRSEIPSVTHIDYSARIQSVHKQTNPRYYALLQRFYELTSCPVLVNTSFNVRGEPIVCSPQDSFACFMGTEMDMLVIEDFVLYKDAQSGENRERYRNIKDSYELD